MGKTVYFKNGIIKDSIGKYKVKFVTINSKVDESIDYKINTWIAKYGNNNNYSCAGFLYYMMYGNDFKSPNEWKALPSSEPTNYIVMDTTDNSLNFHFAIYIPKLDMYISQWGNG